MTIVVYEASRNRILVDTKITDNQGRVEFASKIHHLPTGVMALSGSVFAAAVVASQMERLESLKSCRMHIEGLDHIVEGFAVSSEGDAYNVCLEKSWLDIVKWTPGKAIALGSGSEYFEAFFSITHDVKRAIILTALTHPQCGGAIQTASRLKSDSFAIPQSLEPEDILYHSDAELADTYLHGFD